MTETLADEVLCVRINGDVKQQASDVLDSMGLTLSDVVRVLCLRIATEKKLPFPAEVPNKASLHALEELERGEVTRYEKARDFFKEMKP